MNDREQLVKEAEELAEWLDEWDSSEKSNCFADKAALIRRLLSLLPKEGEVVVPRNPTDAMNQAGYAKMRECSSAEQLMGHASEESIYKAMIEARPK